MTTTPSGLIDAGTNNPAKPHTWRCTDCGQTGQARNRERAFAAFTAHWRDHHPDGGTTLVDLIGAWLALAVVILIAIALLVPEADAQPTPAPSPTVKAAAAHVIGDRAQATQRATRFTIRTSVPVNVPERPGNTPRTKPRQLPSGSVSCDALAHVRRKTRTLAIRCAASLTPPKQLPCLVELWDRESGWRWNATGPDPDGNGVRAYGIPQALPGSKMASAGLDWRTNPYTQIRWGLRYIDKRYGSP